MTSVSLLRYRARHDLTQAQCARRLGISLRSQRRYEAGGRPRKYIAERIADITNNEVVFERPRAAE